MRTKPTAVFMAFGTKGDVYPIAAIAAAFASDQGQYQVAFVTHSAHEVFSISQKLKVHLEAKRITYFPVSSPPVMSYQDTAGSSKVSFSLQKNEIMIKHRQECVSIAEGIFGEDPHMDGRLESCRTISVPPLLLNANFRKNFLFYMNIFKMLRLVGWEDVIYWMWPLFTEDWGLWRSHDLHLSFLPFTDPVTGLPRWHERPLSPLLLYGFSKEVVECPDYWPSRVQTCGFWFLPFEWQFSCSSCADISAQRFSRKLNAEEEMCSIHVNLKTFLNASPNQPIFMSLSSIGSMGYLKNPRAFLKVLGNALNITSCRFILFSAGYGPLDAEIKMSAQTLLSPSEQLQLTEDQTSLFGGRLFYFSGDVPYNWLFPKCAAAIHHGGSGSTAAALHAGIPQVICPFVLDQYYWAERMFWLGVAPEPLKNTCLLPDKDDDCYIKEAATMLVKAINRALSPEVKLQASRIANRLSAEDGVSEAVRLIREEINCTSAAL
ncbi:sterol 3-beta-glucosyltransferase isoform X5 [Henckelia pumila]|uniref:sterol 3-beta-glucosyltransferase isoform X5 n=1 Tax=Henckelia pumila TaxID=405737 RepID=UPI003C6E86A0